MASRNIYERTVDEVVQQNDDNTCPECVGRVTTNSRETDYDDCGPIPDDDRSTQGQSG